MFGSPYQQTPGVGHPTIAGQQWGSAEEFILQRRAVLKDWRFVVYPANVGRNEAMKDDWYNPNDQPNIIHENCL